MIFFKSAAPQTLHKHTFADVTRWPKDWKHNWEHVISLWVLENKEERWILLGSIATLANLNDNHLAHKILSAVYPSFRHCLFVCVPARPTLSCVIQFFCLHASDMRVLLSH